MCPINVIMRYGISLFFVLLKKWTGYRYYLGLSENKLNDQKTTKTSKDQRIFILTTWDGLRMTGSRGRSWHVRPVPVARHLPSPSFPCNYFTVQTHPAPLCTRDSNRLRKHAVPGSRLVGGERAAPMRLPLVAGGEGVVRGGRWWWESCDITGTQSGVSHARTRATTICVSQHLITAHP